MSTTSSVSLLTISLAICLSVNVSAEDLQPIGINRPFEKPISLDRLYAEYKELPQSMRPYLSNIQYIRYTFTQTPNCKFQAPSLCEARTANKPHYIVKREIGFNLSQLEPGMQKTLNNNELDGCSDRKFSSLRKISQNEIQIIHKFNVKAHKRACGNTFGANWSYDIAVANGSGTIYTNLIINDPDLVTGAAKGTVGIDIPAVQTKLDNRSLLGFIDINSVGGQILSAFVSTTGISIDALHLGAFDIGFRSLSRNIQETAFSTGVSYVTLAELNKIGSVPKFYDQFESLGRSKEYFMDRHSTAFAIPTTLNIASFTVINAIEGSMYYNIKKSELAQLESYGREPESHTVLKGESLWKISNSHYGTGQLMYALADFNNISSLKMTLQPGQQLSIPPLYMLNILSAKIITPGSNLWNHWKTNCPDITWMEYKSTRVIGSNSKNRVYPLQITNGCYQKTTKLQKPPDQLMRANAAPIIQESSSLTQ